MGVVSSIFTSFALEAAAALVSVVLGVDDFVSGLGGGFRRRADDEITTVSSRSEVVDLLLEKLRSLKIATPILTAPLEEETSLTDILVRKPSSSSASVNPMVLLELFSMYCDWQEAKIQTIRRDYFASSIRSSCIAGYLGELKGRLTEAISNCDSLCKRINAEGPESLRSSVKPFSVTSADVETSCRSHGKSVK
ncbi:hypothetical protein LOK49_LG09G01854 [Camellia lanceoleosa]|uniref:Uncharacterized protein n=1 Tax=Camellia lanceoleosa TaxID=1840588 RepID=A0ACC0GGY6_9ERIC|nr:hypothetical protein LOK49_LG09G01854 [Camellia lanceoleosa]